jgi:GDP-L-fucose synthase
MSLLQATDLIAIFGATGMAGSAIAKALSLNGFSNQLHPSRGELDLTNSLLVNDWMKLNKPDIVVLAAAKVGGIAANSNYPVDFLLENLKIQNNVIESAWRNNVRRLLFLGSSCIYPKYAPQPIVEESLLDGCLEPTNQSYAIAKIAGIQLCQSLFNQYGFDAICLMPTNLYGPGDNYDPSSSHVFASMIRRFIQAKRENIESVTCWGSGLPMREFLHVDDLASASIHCLKYWDRKSPLAPRTTDGELLHHLNVGTGVDISIYELANLIAERVGYLGKISWDTSLPDGTPKKQLNICRLQNLGWKSSIELKDGIDSTIETYTNAL